jgi:hypothetical protein
MLEPILVEKCLEAFGGIRFDVPQPRFRKRPAQNLSSKRGKVSRGTVSARPQRV